MQLRFNLIAVIIALTAVFVLLLMPTPTPIRTAVAGATTPDIYNYLPYIVKPAEPTVTPIPTTAPTPTTPPANVQITLIVYNPAGDDVAGEYVRIENKGGTAANMTSWTLSDNDSHVYNFPGGFSLAPGAAVLVWVKSGANNTTNLYWGSAQAYWNNTGDTAYLRNSGTLVDSCGYAGGGVQASC